MITVTTPFTTERLPSLQDAELLIAGFTGAKHYRPLSETERRMVEAGRSVERVFGSLRVEVRSEDQ